MKKILVLLAGIPVLIFVVVFGYLLYKGPRMTVQHHIREYQMIMPSRVAGTVAVAPAERLPSAAKATGLRNPLSPTLVNTGRGGVYYQYYCVFCHGDNGAGDGPVGQSYIPRVPDLRTQKVATLSDGELLRSMLTGIGHEPVLERVVPPEYRWYLVQFVRSLPHAK
jgi:mono/diheme cytochrome c family protein